LLNKKKLIKLQYTITILPGFIQPFARKTTESIINANIDYINNKICQQEAAFNIGYENRSSFAKYYMRINERIDSWILLLTKKISEITNTNNFTPKPFIKKSIQEKWGLFTGLTNKYFKVIDNIVTNLIIFKSDTLSCILALFSSSIKGLGP
jgi:hypothetical protein